MSINEDWYGNWFNLQLLLYRVNQWFRFDLWKKKNLEEKEINYLSNNIAVKRRSLRDDTSYTNVINIVGHIAYTWRHLLKIEPNLLTDLMDIRYTKEKENPTTTFRTSERKLACRDPGTCIQLGSFLITNAVSPHWSKTFSTNPLYQP